ncbi:MAG: phosphoribosyltransferase family protein [Halobacteriales archaeon]
MNRVEKATLQLRAVEILRVLKEHRTYEELAAVTDLPAGDLNRYVNGHVLPGLDRAARIVGDLGRELLADELKARIRTDADGYVDTTEAVFAQSLLDLVPAVATETNDFQRPDVVLTAATDGITLGAAMARQFDARCAYAKKTKETAVEEFIESRKRLESGIELTYYLPMTAIAPNDAVLVVDDLIRSGETQDILLNIIERAGATTVGVFALIAAGEEGLIRTRNRVDAPVDALVIVD